ncbi:MAG: hypothetical protein RMK84_13940 [Oscillochloridaceae bacterium]|nr:hypothetical protein [Chloroflexaceae bacterium]MDW8391221.1 hypothetical protein [Oscillochloridaceae bacterium]
MRIPIGHEAAYLTDMHPSFRNNLSDSDLELLSAYIDNALSPAERANLERRLAADPRLRAELEELQTTTRLLRQLEPVRPPRSFTLDPATAPRPAPAFPLNWFMQLGSGLAGLALVLLATIQIVASTSGVAGVAPAAAPAASEVSTKGAQPTPAADTRSPAALPTVEAGAASAPVDPPLPPDAAVPQTGATAIPAQASPLEASPAPVVRPGFPPGLTLALGIALIALALGWRFLGR